MAAIIEDPDLRSSGFAVLELDLLAAPPEVEFVVLFPEYDLSLAEDGEKALTPHVFRAPLIDFAGGTARYSLGPSICYFINDFDLVEIVAPDKGFSTGEFGWPRIGLGDWRPGKPVPTRDEALQAYRLRHGKPQAPKGTVKETAAPETPKLKPTPQAVPPPAPPKVAEVPKSSVREVKAKDKDARKVEGLRYGRVAAVGTLVVAIIGGVTWFFRQELGLVPTGSELPTTASTLGCEGSKVLFAEKFDRPNPQWVTAVANNDVSPKFQDGKMVVDLPNDDSVWVINEESRYGDIDICMRVVAIDDPAGANVGLAFWYSDLDKAHYFVVYPSSRRAVVFESGGEKYEWFASDAIKSDAGAVNELRVTTRGSEATMFINGVEVQKKTGEPPRDGQLVGMVAASPKDKAATFAFEEFKIIQP